MLANSNSDWIKELVKYPVKGLVANRISIFLLPSDKGKRIYTNKEIFYKDNESKYDFFLPDLIKIEYRNQLFFALQNPYAYFAKNISPHVYK